MLDQKPKKRKFEDKKLCSILMALRGRGRGRGRGGGFDTRLARHEPYILFPENVSLPDLPNAEAFTNEERVLITGKIKLEYFWKASCYHLEEGSLKSSKIGHKSQDSDNPKRRAQVKREALSSYLKLTSSNFPAELIHGSKWLESDRKKLRWDQGSDERKLEIFEKLEERSKGHNEKDAHASERKGESDDEGLAEGEAEEESSEDDYNQNVDFDDDEDDLNMEEEADEDFYE